MFYQTAQLGLVNPDPSPGETKHLECTESSFFSIKEYIRDLIITFYQRKYTSCNQWRVVELKTLNLNNFRHTYPFRTILGQDERSRRALFKYVQN